MAVHHWYSDPVAGAVELTSRIDRTTWKYQERAEEGAYGSAPIVINDLAMDLDLNGFRPYWVTEDTSEATDNVLFGGYLHGQSVKRGYDNEVQPQGRQWSCEVVDANSVWNRRVMIGSDCKRNVEDDTVRVAWMLSTAEAGIFDDVTTYVDGGSGVNMDKVDYRRQYRDQVMSDASQASNRNWWVQLQETGAGRDLVVWYGADTRALYDSPLYLSNDSADWADDALADGTSLVWPMSDDTELKRDFGRVYSGVLVEYAKGAVYRHSAATTSAYCRRDFVARYPNVKTKPKAIVRAERLLAKLDTPTLIVTTTIELPAAKATMIRAGMRIPARGTHFTDGLDAWHWYRVLTCTSSPVANEERIQLELELEPTGQSADAPLVPSAACSLIDVSSTAAGVYFGNGSATTQAPGNLLYLKPGIDGVYVPTTGFVGAWNFPDYANDAAGDCAGNYARVIVAGSGSLTIRVADFSGGTHLYSWKIRYFDGGVHDHSTGADDAGVTIVSAGVKEFTFAIPDDEHCYHLVEISDNGDTCGGKWQFVFWDWAPTTL